jgi:hypothetical protein
MLEVIIPNITCKNMKTYFQIIHMGSSFGVAEGFAPMAGVIVV